MKEKTHLLITVRLMAAECFTDFQEWGRERSRMSKTAAVLFLVGPWPLFADEMEDQETALL